MWKQAWNVEKLSSLAIFAIQGRITKHFASDVERTLTLAFAKKGGNPESWPVHFFPMNFPFSSQNEGFLFSQAQMVHFAIWPNCIFNMSEGFAIFRVSYEFFSQSRDPAMKDVYCESGCKTGLISLFPKLLRIFIYQLWDFYDFASTRKHNGRRNAKATNNQSSK